jgi:hypothetical protein
MQPNGQIVPDALVLLPGTPTDADPHVSSIGWRENQNPHADAPASAKALGQPTQDSDHNRQGGGLGAPIPERREATVEVKEEGRLAHGTEGRIFGYSYLSVHSFIYLPLKHYH